MPCQLITTYAKLGHGRRAGGQAPPPPPPPPPQAPPREDAEEEEEKEADDVSLSFYEFLEGLDAVQEGEVPPADLQAAIAVSFEMQRQERDVSRAAQWKGMAPRHPPPSPAVLLYQEMVCGRVERQQAMAGSITRCAWVSASKEATGSEAGPSSTQPAPLHDDDHMF
jgi:hypothetical protein